MTTLQSLHEECSGNDTLVQVLEDTLRYSRRYLRAVAKMEETIRNGIDTRREAENLQRQDEARTRLHNATIDSINILARTLRKAGRDSSWIERVSGSRRAYGEFALQLACVDLIQGQVEGRSIANSELSDNAIAPENSKEEDLLILQYAQLVTDVRKGVSVDEERLAEIEEALEMTRKQILRRTLQLVGVEPPTQPI